jgi:hypothetical protein
MNMPEVLHELIERVSWGSEDNKAEAHAAVEADLAPVPPAKEGK